MAQTPQDESQPLEESPLTRQPKIKPKYVANRDVLFVNELTEKTGYSVPDRGIRSACTKYKKNCSFKKTIFNFIPILDWLPKYSWKKDTVGDIIAGLTVAVMNIPHGMAYGVLAGLTAECGLYLAIFPVLIYIIFGTAKHVSLGTFAVISMMTLKVVQEYADSSATGDHKESANNYTAIEVATSLAMSVGLIQFAMGALCLGFISVLLSVPLVNGFTAGAACHVVVSQLKDIFGVSVKRHKGIFKIVRTVIDICEKIPETNIATFIFCMVVIVFMIISQEQLKPRLAKICKFPFPAELIAVISGTLFSKFMHVDKVYGMRVIGDIPNNLPIPTLPNLGLSIKLLVDGFAIAIVSFSVLMSLGVDFARKHKYTVRANQELFALGLANMFGGCFSCYPLGVSLSRSVIQEKSGGASQLASLVSAGIITSVVLWLSWFFKDLPMCVLAGIIVVALKSMFTQLKDVKLFAKQGLGELAVWGATFFSVVLLDIDIGLGIGLFLSLLCYYFKGVKSHSTLLGTTPDAPEVYVDLQNNRNAKELENMKIFRFNGPINFATAEVFRKKLFEAIELNKKDNKKLKLLKNQAKVIENGVKPEEVSQLQPAGAGFQHLVIDLTTATHIDVAGCHVLTEIKKELSSHTIRLFLAVKTDSTYEALVYSMNLGEGPFEMFPSLHDAVNYAKACNLS